MPINYRTLIALLVAARVAGAQDPTPGVDLPTDARSSVYVSGHAGFLGLPVLHASPMLGFGLGAVGAFLNRIDSTSPPSVIGAGAVYTASQSWLFAVGSRVHFHGGSRNGAAGVELFDLHYDFFGIGVDQGKADHHIPIVQRGDAEMVEMLGRLVGNFYLGPRYMHRGVTTTLKAEHTNDPLTPVANQNLDYHASALGMEAVYDTRDSDEFPRHGTNGELSAMFARGWLGTTSPYNSYHGWINHYLSLSSDAVLALRLVGCSVDAGAPIWELCLYGINSDLRGYQGGRYRDHTMFASQAEIRLPFTERLGSNFFGGVGTVAPSFSAVTAGGLLPSGGLGMQYLVSTAYRLNVGADVAWGRNGAGFYLRLGQAF